MTKNICLKETIKSILFLAISTTIIWSLISGILMGIFGFIKHSSSSSSDSLKSIISLFLLCISNGVLVVWYTKRSHYTDKKLFANIMFLIFGIFSFMTQIETLYFNDSVKMPLLMLLITVFTEAIISTFCGIFAVKMKNKSKKQIQSNYALHLDSMKKNVGKFTLLAFIYMIFYFFFGYYIAWQFPELRQFYSGSTDILPFITHIQNQLHKDAFLVVFQIFRGFLWTFIGYMLLRGIAVKSNIERYVLMGLLLSIPLATPLFVPNDFMPSGVRFGHFFELLIENFLFGVILTYILPTNKKSR